MPKSCLIHTKKTYCFHTVSIKLYPKSNKHRKNDKTVTVYDDIVTVFIDVTQMYYSANTCIRKTQQIYYHTYHISMQ